MSTHRPEGLLAVFVDVPGDLKADFDLWYEREHLPTLRALPGFHSASLYESVDDPAANLALYQLDDVAVLLRPEYLEFRQATDSELGHRVRAGWKNHTRLIYTLRLARVPAEAALIDAPFLSVVRAFVTPGSEDGFRRWLDEEHSIRQLGVQGAVSYHGFELVEGSPFHFLNIWGIEQPEVGSSEEWERARDTPWRARTASVIERSLRGTYRPLFKM